MSLLRRQKVVVVSSKEYSDTSGASLTYAHQKLSSCSTKTSVSVKAPINGINLVMMELFPDSQSKEMDATLICNGLNFMTLCCGENATAEDVRFNFETEYPFVEQITFSGHIGSMRLAFDLLKFFKNCREVVFVVNDYNARLQNDHADNFIGIPQYSNIESVKVTQDFSNLNMEMMDMSSSWRLHEFLEGCKECFPNLKMFEVNIYGTGANYDKINGFIMGHNHLNKCYTIGLSNGKLKTRPKQHALPSSSLRMALPPVPVGALVGAEGRSPAHQYAVQHLPVAQPPQDGSLTIPIERERRSEDELLQENSSFSKATKEDDNDSRFRAARNPSPPPIHVVNPSAFLGNGIANPFQVVEQRNERRPRPNPPPPPVISKSQTYINGLAEYSKDGKLSSSHSLPGNGGLNEQKDSPRDPRAKRQTYGSTRSPFSSRVGSPRSSRSTHYSNVSGRVAASKGTEGHSDSRRRSMSTSSTVGSTKCAISRWRKKTLGLRIISR